jgi:hypothetical protein
MASAERRKISRKEFSYYMRVMDESTGKVVGHLSDISTGGFKLDCKQAIPLNVNMRLRIDLTPEVAKKEYMLFVARPKWCQADRFEPTSFNVGFQIVEMTPADLDIFVRMFERYGSQKVAGRKKDSDYLWK